MSVSLYLYMPMDYNFCTKKILAFSGGLEPANRLCMHHWLISLLLIIIILIIICRVTDSVNEFYIVHEI